MNDNYTWLNSFQKSLSDNAQLVFSKKITISTINPEDNLSYSEILDLKEIKSLDSQGKDNALIFYVDNRTIFYNSLKQNSMAHLANYFPLSREKYKMNCLIYALSGDGENITELSNKAQFKNYININYKYIQQFKEKSLLLNETQYKDISQEYFYQYLNEIDKCKHDQILNSFWSKLSNEEKLEYDTVDKDSIKLNENLNSEKMSKDVENFEAQEEILFSKNFTVLYIIPVDVEHTLLPMPQVVANSRRPNFESLMKPHKKPKKYNFLFNFSDGNWILKELNI